jgi:MOSC domain-containing protein YiiM
MDAHVEQLFTAPDGSAEMESREEVTCEPGGIVGDRYYSGDGHFAPYDTCPVTLLAWEDIVEIDEEFGIDLSDGRHRRNVVTRGVEPTELLDVTFRLGEAMLRGTRRRPPCAHVEQLAGEDGVSESLGDGRAGICADVVDGGAVAVGDSIEIVEADPRTVGEDIAARLRNRVDPEEHDRDDG